MTAAFGMFVMASCGNYDNPSGLLGGGVDPSSLDPLVWQIPSDNGATPAPAILSPNLTLPASVNTTLTVEGGLLPGTFYNVASITMPGMKNPNTGDWLILHGTYRADQNVWITVDGKPKGFTVYNSMCDDIAENIPIDLVFMVDNSSSMGSESDQIANEIKTWANSLSSSLDFRFACIGYGYTGTITGGIDLTDVNSLSNFLDRSTSYNRTIGFEPTGGSLQTAAANPTYSISTRMDECGVLAARFAEDNLSWRSGARRIFINITDEPNQPNGKSDFSVEWLNPTAGNWTTTDGEIHSVYLGGTSPSWWDGTNNSSAINSQEDPGLMADYTGGTRYVGTAASFSLNVLPITSLLQEYYLFRFTDIEDLVNDGNYHQVVITIYAEDGSVQGEQVYNVKFE